MRQEASFEVPLAKIDFGSFGAKLGDLGKFQGINWRVLGKFRSNDTYYGIRCTKTRRLRYSMPKLILGHFGAKFGGLGTFTGKIGEFGGKLGQMTLTTAFLSPRRVV